MAFSLALGFCLFVMLASASNAAGDLCNHTCTLTELLTATHPRNVLDAFCSDWDSTKTCAQQHEAATNCTPSDEWINNEAVYDYVCSSEIRQVYLDHLLCLGNFTGMIPDLQKCYYYLSSFTCSAFHATLDCYKEVYSGVCGEKAGRFWATFVSKAYTSIFRSLSCMPYENSSPTTTQDSVSNNSSSTTPAMSLTLVTVPAAVIMWLITIWM